MDFKNEVAFLEQDDQYKMVWSNSVIYPGLTEDDKVRVSVIQAQRGQILDRNGRMLAGKGVASSVGIIPGKLENRKKSIVRIAKLLGIKPEDIEKELTAKWVKEERQKILVQAQNEADDIIKEAENRIISMIDEHEITRKAYDQKNEIIETANEMSREITNGTMYYQV